MTKEQEIYAKCYKCSTTLNGDVFFLSSMAYFKDSKKLNKTSAAVFCRMCLMRFIPASLFPSVPMAKENQENKDEDAK